LYLLTKEFDLAIADYETVRLLDKNNKEEADKKIALAKQKQQENRIQSK
jgi:hypothetical protein